MVADVGFEDRLAVLIEQHGQEGGNVGLLLVRVQRLGETNLVGSPELMQAARERLQKSLRLVDEFVQIGGCDFAVFLPGIRSANHAALAANRLVRAFQAPLPVAGRPVQTVLCVGGAMFPEHGRTVAGLSQRAEVAFGKAMSSSERYVMHGLHEEQLELSYPEFREAILNNRLAVHLQPFWDLRHDRVAGLESLARWDSEQQGRIPPDLFIPYAEQTGLITQLTRWSINTTLRYCGQVRRTGRDLPFSINLSARVFHEQGIVEQIVGATELWGVRPERVLLEVTENAIMSDQDLSARVLSRLRDQGFRIAIDDFGSGYSSFSYLKRFPATELKIDKQFVIGMSQDERSAQLVRAMIDMAHHMEMDAIAEGVEDADTALMLAEMDCDFAQGFFYGQPTLAETYLEKHFPPTH